MYDNSIEVTIWELVHDDENSALLTNAQFEKLMEKEGFFESETVVEPDQGLLDKFASTAAARAAMILAKSSIPSSKIAAPVINFDKEMSSMNSIEEKTKGFKAKPSTTKTSKTMGMENFEQWIKYKAEAMERKQKTLAAKDLKQSETTEVTPDDSKMRSHRVTIQSASYNVDHSLLDPRINLIMQLFSQKSRLSNCQKRNL